MGIGDMEWKRGRGGFQECWIWIPIEVSLHNWSKQTILIAETFRQVSCLTPLPFLTIQIQSKQTLNTPRNQYFKLILLILLQKCKASNISVPLCNLTFLPNAFTIHPFFLHARIAPSRPHCRVFLPSLHNISLFDRNTHNSPSVTWDPSAAGSQWRDIFIRGNESRAGGVVLQKDLWCCVTWCTGNVLV
jgi:hypothetical protein